MSAVPVAPSEKVYQDLKKILGDGTVETDFTRLITALKSAPLTKNIMELFLNVAGIFRASTASDASSEGTEQTCTL